MLAPLVILIALFIANINVAAQSQVRSYANIYKTDSMRTDSSAAVITQVDSLTGNQESGAADSSGAPLFYFDNLGGADVSVVTGWFEAYIDTVDNDSVGSSVTATTPDTTGNDTLILTIYTAFRKHWGTATTYARSGEEALVACTLQAMCYSAAGATGSVGAKFTIPATAGIGDVLYGRLTWKYQQPAASLDDTSQIVYMTYCRMIAR